MILRSLKTLAKQANPSEVSLQVQERLPYYVQSPCELHCKLVVRQESHYYHLNLQISGRLTIHCQRCAQDFQHDYEHSSELAICPDEEMADRMMSRLDCIVQTEDDLDLLAVVTDDIHLFCPEKHENC
jgi:uncharacterized protein